MDTRDDGAARREWPARHEGADRAEERAQKEARRAERALAMGARVKGLRGFRRYTQEQLGAITGLSKNYISGLELGRRPCPRPDTVERLAVALGVTVAQLRGGEPLPERPGDGDEAAAGPGRAAEAEQVAAALRQLGQGPPVGLMVRVVALLADLPPGVAVTHRRYADGGILVYIRPPGAADRVPDHDGG